MNGTKTPGFFSVFLLTIMVVVEVAVLAGVWRLQLLPGAVNGGVGALLLCVTLLAWRLIFPRKRSLVLLKRLAGCVLTLCVTAACLGGVFGVVVMGDTLDSMFGSLPPVTTYAPKDPTKEPFVIYLGGSDTRSSKLDKSRNDVNILAVVNPGTKQALLVNTPRDYYVSNPAGGGAKDKLAHIGLYGMDNCKQTLGDLYDVPVAYGALINFKGFETLIDALGGITVDSDVAFSTDSGYRFTAGENQLNGAQALAFARERYHLSGGDNARGQNQMKVLKAMVQKLSDGGVLANYREILDSLEGMFTTDMPLRTITRLAMNELGNLSDWEIHSTAVTGTGGTAYNYSSKGNAYVTYPDEDSVAAAKEMIEEIMNG